jgi:chemotaxis protein MotB
VLFDSGKADLKSSAAPTLKDICSTIKQRYPNNFIRVEGHTDSTPVVRNKDKFKDNMELSIVRSRAVYDFMIHSGGIAANKMYTAGYGEFQPIVRPERTASDRAQNRRVEIVIMPTDVRIEKQKMTEASSPKVQTASITAKKK